MNVPHSAFCSSECKTVECDILCISFVTTAQSHGSTFCLLFPYLLTVGLLWSQESTCCNLLFRSKPEWTSFCKRLSRPSETSNSEVSWEFLSQTVHSERISLLSNPSGWCSNCNLQVTRSHVCVCVCERQYNTFALFKTLISTLTIKSSVSGQQCQILQTNITVHLCFLHLF